MFENIQLAFQGVFGHKLRSFLTMLGIIIGIASIITIISTIKGTNEQIKQNLIGSGSNIVNVQLYQNDWAVDMSYQTPDGIRVLQDEQRDEMIALDGVADVTLYRSREKTDVIIVDECQFLTPAQIDQLRDIVDVENIPVLCFGLRTDFQCKLFDGSRRLFEVADTITEIKAICDCGAKATVNARLDSEGCIVTEGAQLLLGGNDRYLAMCHKCWIRNIREHRKVKNR